MNWENVEKVVGETLPICVKSILSACGYDTFSSLKFITEDSVNEIEDHINTWSRNTIDALNCCYSEHYKRIGEFNLLPGHKNLIISLSKFNYVANEVIHSVHDSHMDSQELSCVLTELLNAANQAANNSNQKCSLYTDTLRWFATYIFLLCGRSCYEVLNHNLPLPSTKTVCKFNLYRIVNLLCNVCHGVNHGVNTCVYITKKMFFSFEKF